MSQAPVGTDWKQAARAQFEEFLSAMEYAKTQKLNWMELEHKSEDYSLELGRTLLGVRLNSDPRSDPDARQECPKCKGKLRITKRRQQRPLTTLLGEMVYIRPYGVCRCGYRGAPLDEALGIPSSGPSIGSLERICHASVVGRSFEKGQEILSIHSGIEFSRKHVRKLAEGEGRRLMEQRDTEVTLYREHKLDVKAAQAPGLIVVAADGGRIQSRQPVGNEDRWKEDKIGVVYDAAPQLDRAASFKKYRGAKANIKTYVATMEPWERFGWMLRLEAERRGYNKAKVKLFLGDGAKTVREAQRFHFSDATFILDWCHAMQHLTADAEAGFGAETQQAHEWKDKHETMLWDGKRDEIIADLQALSKRLGSPLDSDPVNHPRRILHRDAFSYFPNNRDAIDYPSFRAKGWPLGSGVAEGSVKQFNIRLKGSDKFWNVSEPEVPKPTRTGAEEMLALCALYESEDGRWDRYWKKRAQPQRRE